MRHDGRAELAVERVRQAVLELVPVGAEQPLEGVPHDEEAHAVVEVGGQLLRARPGVALPGQRHRHGLRRLEELGAVAADDQIIRLIIIDTKCLSKGVEWIIDPLALGTRACSDIIANATSYNETDVVFKSAPIRARLSHRREWDRVF